MPRFVLLQTNKRTSVERELLSESFQEIRELSFELLPTVFEMGKKINGAKTTNSWLTVLKN